MKRRADKLHSRLHSCALLIVVSWSLALPAHAQQAEPASGEVSPTGICIDCEPDPPPVNQPPVVGLTEPDGGESYLAGSSVALTATAADSDGNVNRVEFLVDGVEVGQDTSSPYAVNWIATVGNHTVQARAFDNGGASNTTTAASISVNALPVVSLTEPDGGESYVAGSSVAFTATASDSGGSVNRVEFLVDGAEVAQDTTSPYGVNWIATVGSHTVQARAFDNVGASRTTTAVSISVNVLPAVSLIEPGGGEHYVTGSSVELTATASDSNGSVSRVEFLVDGAEVAQDTSSPYSIFWTATVGSHTVQARAVDNMGGSKTTAAVSIGVAANTAPSVTLTAPASGQSMLAGSVVALTATASDLEGSVNRVEFLVDGTEIGQDTTSGYSINWTATEGSHTIAARAVDNLGASRTTAAITVSTSGITRQYVYDDHQQLCKVIEPETGATLMGYDAAGNLAWSASGLPVDTACSETGDTAAILPRRVARQYDARNRIIALRFPDGRGDQDWSYTATGLPDQIVTYNAEFQGAAVINTYAYNKRQMLTAETSTHADGTVWAAGYGYDGLGHLASQTYPDGRVVQYAPNALGQATRVDDPAMANPHAWGAAYYPNGALKSFVYGNGIVHTMVQNARGLPERSSDAYGTTRFLDDSYDYDANGNVVAISDGATGRNQRGNRDMSYDALDRLKTVASPMYGATGAAYSYDSLDNLTHVVAPGRDHYYCYDGSNRLSNVKTGSCSGATVTGLGYDPQGNLANKDGTQYAFDYGNRLRTVDYAGSAVEAYQYDGHGRRVLATSPAGTIASFYSQGGQLLYQDNGRDGQTHSYLYLAGSLVNDFTHDKATGVNANHYQHTDALGSPVAVTNGSRAVLERREYEPYGKQLAPTPQDGPGYTGHVYDAATGLSYMQQRYYDPGIGRFLSVDPVTADGNSGGNFNRYWYANNNPYRFTDPDGRQPACNACDNWSDAVADAHKEGRQDELKPFEAPAIVATAVMAAPVLAVIGAEGMTAVLANPGAVTTATNLVAEATGVTVAGAGLGNQNQLYKAAVQQFKGTALSVAGRALTKHPEIVGATKETLRQTLRTDGAINNSAHAALQGILRNGVTTTPTLGRYGSVTQVQVPGGFGARWNSDGNFIGFINP